jgi:hypothetical protein
VGGKGGEEKCPVTKAVEHWKWSLVSPTVTDVEIIRMI